MAVALRGGARRVRACATFTAGQPHGGTVFVQGTTSTANLVKVLPKLDERGLNVKIVACISPAAVRACRTRPTGTTSRSLGDRWDGMAITNRAWQTDARLGRRPDRRASTRCHPTGTTAGAPAARSTR